MTDPQTTTEELRKEFEQHLFEEDSPPLSKEEKITVDCFIDFLKEKGVLK